MIPALALVAATLLSPLAPATRVPLAELGSAASDVTWINDREVLVALIQGGVIKVAVDSGKAARWMPEGELPSGVPFAELIDADERVVAVGGGGKAWIAFLTPDRKYLDGASGGRLYARGLAVSGGQAYVSGWISRMQTDADQQKGALWRHHPGDALADRPIHRIVSGDVALDRWRKTMHPYGGSVVALADGSIAVSTSAEPGIYRYDRSGKLLEVLGSGVDEVVVDSTRLVKYGQDIFGRYREVLDKQPSIDDLIATPGGVAYLIRTSANGKVSWQLWYPNRTEIVRKQPLTLTVNGPVAHMKCDARGKRLACVTNLPTPEQAKQIGGAGSQPMLFIFSLQ